MFPVPVSVRPLCSQCRYYKPALKRCSLFVQIIPDNIPTSTLAAYAREDPYMCGPDGLYFSDKDKRHSVLK